MTSPQPKVWHGREPDVRCDWNVGGPGHCAAQAISIIVDGSQRRPFCADHATDGERGSALVAALLGDQERVRSCPQPLIRDPRPISLLCGGLAGSWTPEMDRLLAQSLDRDASADDRAGAEAILLDLAEQRGLDSGGWERVERRWMPTLREEVLPILDGVSASRPAVLVGDTWDEVFAGDVTWSVNGWLVRVFNDCGEWDYIDSLVTPDGREVDYDALPDVIRFWSPGTVDGWPSLPKWRSPAPMFGTHESGE